MSAWCASARPFASLHVLAVVYGMNLLNYATRGSLVRRGCALARSSEGAARQDAIENKPRNRLLPTVGGRHCALAVGLWYRHRCYQL